MKKRNFSHLTEQEKLEVKKLETQNRNFHIKNLCIFGGLTLYVTALWIAIGKKQDSTYFPLVNEKISYYSNDELTYSSLDSMVMRKQQEDVSCLTKLDPTERLVIYSDWEKIGNYWCRMVDHVNLSEEENGILENLVSTNASSETWQEALTNIQKEGDYTIQTQLEEPSNKQGYFEFKMIDDTSYEIEPTLKVKLLHTVSFLIFDGSIVGMAGIAISFITQNVDIKENNRKIKELIQTKERKTI